MSNIHFERRKQYRSFSIFVMLIIVLLLLLFVPIMLISRTKTIINHKLDRAEADTTYVKLVAAGLSYLETADAFVIFRSKDERLRDELLTKAEERFAEQCGTVDSAAVDSFCQAWKKVLSDSQLNKCEKCADK